MTGSGRKLRFLFVMQYPGYLRYFDSTVRLLAARGHHVDIAFDSPHKPAEGAEALAGVENVTVTDRTPARGDVWALVAPGVRGTIDYTRYLHPSFADARYLRARMRVALPPVFAMLGRWNTASASTTRTLIRMFTALERATPSSPALERFIQSRDPDAVLVTPLVTDRCSQVDVIKSAQALGIPTGLCVASWDHLTTKEFIDVRRFFTGGSVLDLDYVFQTDLFGRVPNPGGDRVTVFFKELWDFGGGVGGGKTIDIGKADPGQRGYRVDVGLLYHELTHCIDDTDPIFEGFREGPSVTEIHAHH